MVETVNTRDDEEQQRGDDGPPDLERVVAVALHRELVVVVAPVAELEAEVEDRGEHQDPDDPGDRVDGRDQRLDQLRLAPWGVRVVSGLPPLANTADSESTM